MAIRDETTSTNELLRDARFHRASLMADKKAKDLAPVVKSAEADVRKARDDHEEHKKPPTYIACFPKGLGAIISLRGEAEAMSVRVLIKELTARVPDVAAKHADNLEELAEGSVVAEKEWKSAEVAAAQAGALERAARMDLVRQLQKNEGVLLECRRRLKTRTVRHAQATSRCER